MRFILTRLPVFLLTLLLAACASIPSGGGGPTTTPTPLSPASCTGQTTLEPSPGTQPFTTIQCPSSGYTIKVVNLSTTKVFRGQTECGPSISHPIQSGSFSNDLFWVDCSDWILVTAVNTDSSGVGGASYYELPKHSSSPLQFSMSLKSAEGGIKKVTVSVSFDKAIKITVVG